VVACTTYTFTSIIFGCDKSTQMLLKCSKCNKKVDLLTNFITRIEVIRWSLVQVLLALPSFLGCDKSLKTSLECSNNEKKVHFLTNFNRRVEGIRGSHVRLLILAPPAFPVDSHVFLCGSTKKA